MFKQDALGTTGNEKGMVLVVCLLLIVVLALLGSTAVVTSSTDLNIARNYKTSLQALYVSESGIEEGRTRLRASSINPITDAHPTNGSWQGYIGIQSNAQAKGYNAGNSMHLWVASLQTTPGYTVKIQHQTNAGSQLLYWGDANNDGKNERNTTTGQNIYLITSYGTAAGANKTVTVEVAKVPPINVPGALYVKAATTVQGNANVIGTDDCPTNSSKPGVVSPLGPGSVISSGSATIQGTGSPPSVAYGGPNMDVQGLLDSWKGSANFRYTVNSDTQSGMNWGVPVVGATLTNASSCNVSNIVYYDTGGTDIRLSGGTTGCGILLVDGDLEISGNFLWYGVIIVSGSVTYTGGGDKNITGGMISGGSVDADLVGGNTNIVYCGTAVNNQTQNQPLITLTWMDNT